MTPSAILTTTALVYGLAPADLRSRNRTRQVAEARAVAAYLAYELTGASYRELAVELGRKKSVVSEMVDSIAARLGVRERRLSEMVRRVELECPGSVREVGHDGE